MNQEITKQIELTSREFLKIQKTVVSVSNFKEELEKTINKNVTEVTKFILGAGVSLDGSDLHLETQKRDVVLRIRIDGVLHEVSKIPTQSYEKILPRLKLLSGIKLNITDRPQDGRFSVLIQKNTVEIRTSTLPSEHGESIVLRILNPQDLINLEQSGIREELLQLIGKEIKKPHGMIIVTGPTGSGKTTTLYSFLMKIKSPKIKIITIEDPIEYHLEGISQTQVSPKKGYDFASGLKSIMRQDPNVILVGEIRDLETAQIAIQAALTGHLVLTTLHTNDAAGTVPRLVSLGAKPVNIAPALNLTIAQRLIRRVCKECSKLEPVTGEELKKIKKAFAKVPKLKTPPLDKNLKISKSKGCKSCNNTGYKGRIGIFETFLVGEKLESFILTSPSISALKEKATKEGMVPIYQDGLLKVLKGISTLEELERIVAE